MIKPEYEYRTINSKEICVDPLYQRDLSDAKVGKIVKSFNPYLVNAVKVSYRDGRWWVFDGQHTIAALKAMRGGKDCAVECKVFYGLTRLDEMNLFIAQNGASSPVQLREKMRALYNNGDPDVTGMVKLAESAGFIVDFKSSDSQRRIRSVSALFNAYKALTTSEYMTMLEVIMGAWKGTPESTTTEIVSGMAKFINTYSSQMDSKALKSFVKQLSVKSPSDIVRYGKAIGAGGSARYARAILSVYNNNRSSKRLEDKF